MLIDTNVLLDVALDRQPHSVAAVELLTRLEQMPGRAFVAWHTISNFYYVFTKAGGSPPPEIFITGLINFVEVVPTGTEAVRYALSLPMDDFEDALQVAAARACGADYIVTRDESDFTASPIPAILPEQALAQLR